jgi:hypothetical protein|tara:strand:- start:41 stop:247 length:207 start_codon:yes stop_codon:yes gene_type:complete
MTKNEFTDLLAKWTDKYIMSMSVDQLRHHVAEDVFTTMLNLRKYGDEREVFDEMIDWGGEDLFNEVSS